MRRSCSCQRSSFDRRGAHIQQPFAITWPAGGSRAPDPPAGACREVLHALPQRSASDRQRIDRIRLPAGSGRPWRAPAVNCAANRTTGLASVDKKTAPGCRTRCERPRSPTDPLRIQGSRPLHQLPVSRRPRGVPSDSATSTPRVVDPRRRCGSACADRCRSSPSVHVPSLDQ